MGEDPLKEIEFFSTLYMLFFLVFNTAYMLSLQSAADFLLDKIHLHLNSLMERCDSVQLCLRPCADMRGSSIPWDGIDASSK